MVKEVQGEIVSEEQPINTTTATKVEETAQSSGLAAPSSEAVTETASSVEKTYSIAELEALIMQEDPDFLSSLGDIGPNTEWEGTDLGRYSLDAPDPKTLRERLVYIKEYIKNKFYYSMILTEQWVYYFFIKFLPASAIKLKNILIKILKYVNGKIRQFTYLPLREKLQYFFIICAVGLVSAYFYFALTTNFLKDQDQLFVHSMEDWADSTHAYDPKSVETFYSSTRTMQNIMSLPRMISNVKKSSRSGPNPMVAFELYFEGTTPEGVVEIKDRDYEIKDRISRLLEESTFDQLDTVEGKQVLLEKVKRDINQVLTKGKVRRVFYKSIILKP